MVDWGAYPDAEEEEVVSRLKSSWLKERWVKIITVVVFLIGVALIIAGSVMLGIGVNKNNQGCPAMPSASPFYATVESTELTYDDVGSNYAHASDIITQQVRSAALGQSQKASFAAAGSNTDPVVTVLGMSKSPSGHVMAVVGIAFTTADAIAPASLENNLNSANKLSLYNAGSTAANSTNQQMCSSVSVYTETPKNNATVAPITTSTPQGCDCSCATSTVAMTTTTENTSTSTTVTSPTTSPTTSTSSSTVTTITNPTSTSTVTPTTSPTTSTSSSTVTTTTVPVTSSSTVTTTSPSTTTSSSTVTTTTSPVTSPTSTVTTTTSPSTSSSTVSTSPLTSTSSSTVTSTTVPVTSSSTVTTTTVPVTSPTSTSTSSSTVTTSTATLTSTLTPSTSSPTSTRLSTVASTTVPVTSSSTVTTTTSPTSTVAVTTSSSTTTSTSSTSTTTPVTSTSPSASSTVTATSPTTVTVSSTSSSTTVTPTTTAVTYPSTTTASTTSPATSASSSSTTSSTATTSSTSTTSQGKTSTVVPSTSTTLHSTVGMTTSSMSSEGTTGLAATTTTSGAPSTTSAQFSSSPSVTTTGASTSTSIVASTSTSPTEANTTLMTTGMTTDGSTTTATTSEALTTSSATSTVPSSPNHPTTTGFTSTVSSTTYPSSITVTSTVIPSSTVPSTSTALHTTSSMSPVDSTGLVTTTFEATVASSTSTAQTTVSTTAPTSTVTTTTTAPTSTGPTTTIGTTSAIPATTALLTTIGSTTAAVTTPACVWSTEAPSVPNRPGARDIVALIDDSTAVGGYQNYSQVTNWLAKQLFPLWPVNEERWEAAPAQYAEHEYNLLMDFDATSNTELSKAVSNSVYSGRNSPSITKALKSTMSLGGRQGVQRFVLLLTASSKISDIESALPLAETIRQSGSNIITVALGDADTNMLAMLSSGPNYDFSSDSFTLTSDQATAITDLIQGQDVITVSTTVPTTTQPTFDFPCHPDVAVVVDTSSDVPSDDEYRRQLSFIAETLAPSWSIGPKGVEPEVVVYSTAFGGQLGLGAFSYQNSQQFSAIVHQFDGYHNQFAIPSIAGSLEYLVSTEGNRRTSRAPTTLLFTYSGAYHDVLSAQNSVASLGNLIIVSMRNNSQYLSALSGNVITGMTYGDSMTTSINSLLCQPSSPVPLTSTVAPSTSSTTLSTSTTATSTQQTTTSVAPVSCMDCYPNEANVLIVMDASSMMMGGKLDQLKAFVNNQLTSSWNHPERLAILSFDDQTHFDAPVDFGDLNSMTEYHQLVGAAPQLPNPPSLASAFKRSLTNFHPISSYGQMNTVIFTISTNDAQNAIPYATQLNQKGTVVIVAMKIADTKALTPLSNNIVSWSSLNDTTGIAEQIETFLGSGAPVTGKSTTTTPLATITTASTSEATTTSPHVTPSASCGRDVILMVDESNAFPDLASFQKLQSWLVSSLIPLWDVSPSRIAVAPFGFTNKTWDDLGGDFQVQSPQELELLLQSNLFYRATMSPGLTSALRKASAVKTPQPSAATLLISASDNPDDVTKASTYANQLKQNGGTVITLAVGSNTNGQLHLLSSGPKFSFNSQSYDISSEIALEISEMLCASAPTVPTTQGPTTTVATTTTTVPPPFSCNPDVVLLFDNSGVNSNETLFQNLVIYTSILVNDWVVGLQVTEASIVMANSIYGVSDTYPWQYQSKFTLEQELMDMSTEYFGGEASIKNMLTNTIFPAGTRRQDAPFTILIFTFSSDYQDVVEAIPIAKSLNANIVAVGLGSSDPNVLGLLTGNVITGLPQGAGLSQAIDAAICNPKGPTVSITTPTTSTSTTTASSTTTTTVASTTTEPMPIGCPDCYPSMSNLLILMDNSNDQSPHTFSDQKQGVVSLVSQWNHFERVGLSSFAGSLQTLVSYNGLGKNELNSLVITINNLQQTSSDVDLGRSLHMATGISPDSDYGEQRTILFTASSTVSDKALSAAATLRSRGQLIVVGVGLSDIGALGTLASAGDAFAWGNVDQPQGIVESIMGALGATSRPTEMVQTITSLPTTTVSQPTLCSQNLLLLLDESNAIPSTVEFNQLKTWVTTKLIPGLPPIAVGPYGYADKDWNDINGGEFLADAQTEEMLINVTYSYKASNGPNIARALQRAAAVQPDGTMTTVIISASAGTDDVAKAVPYSSQLKEEGAVVTLLIGNGNLSPLASDPSMALTSTTFAPDDSVIAKIASVLCVPYTPPSTVVTTFPSTTTSTVTTTSTPVATTTVPISSSTVVTSTIRSTSAIPSTTSPTTTSPTTTFIPDASYNPAEADIVIIFDVSSTVNATELTAQKTLISSLVTNWNHFERVALMDFASQAYSVSNFGDLTSAADVAFLMQQALKPMTSQGNLSSALKFAKKYYPVEAGMHGRNVVLLTSSTATASSAQPAATALQLEGKVVVVSLSVEDNSPLAPLASQNSLVSFNDFTSVGTTAGKINQLLGGSTVPFTTSATVATPMVTVPATTTIDRYIPTEADLVIVFDVSLAANGTIAAQKDLVTTLVSGWTHFERVALMEFSGQPSPVPGAGFKDITSAASLDQRLDSVFQQYSQPNLAIALQYLPQLFPLEQGMTSRNIVFLTTTSTGASDAQTWSDALRSQGSLIIVSVGTFDSKPLNSLATSIVPFPDFSKTTATAAQINKLL